MSRLKKSLLWLLACVALILTILTILKKQGFFEDPAIALRELKKAGIEATGTQARLAAHAKDHTLLERLGRAGVDFTENDENGRSVLHAALEKDQIKMLPLLDRFGIEVNRPDSAGRLPLEEALDKESPQWAQALVDRGAAINFLIGDKIEKTPAPIIYYDTERWDDLAFLIDRGAAPNPIDPKGRSLLAHTVKAGDATWLNRLLAAGAVLTKSDHALAADALEMGRADLLLPLLKAGANPDQRAPKGANLIHRLCRDWSTLNLTEDDAAAVLHELITQGADLETPGPDGLRPIQTVIKYPFYSGQNLLLPEVKDVSSCLHLAIAQKDWPVMKALLQRGAAPDEIIDNETALFTMIKAGQAEMTEALITHGASLEVLGSEGQRPLATAIATGKENVVFTLLTHKRQPELAAHLEFPVSIEYRDLYGRSGLLDWYCRNERQLQPIMVAVMLRQLKVVERFLELGVDKFSATKNKVYPIQMAAKRGDVKMQQLLIGVPYEDDKQARSFIVDLSDQKVYYYKNGELAKSTRCSTGSRSNPTPTGNFVITDRTKDKVSNIYRDSKMPYFQRFSCSEVGFHEGATYSGFLSHGCIRLPMSTAKYFWAEAKIGDRVTIRK